MMTDDKPKRRRSAHGLPKPVKRADGRWMARIELGYIGGTRKRKYVYGATEREVTAKLKPLLHQQQQGVNIAPERQTLAQFLERWMRDVVTVQTRRRSTGRRSRASRGTSGTCSWPSSRPSTSSTAPRARR